MQQAKKFIRAADELVTALVQARAADRFIVDGPGSRKGKAAARVERAEIAYDATRAELQAVLK